MPQVGSDRQPVVLKNKKKNNQKLGLTGKFYSKENKKRYDAGWDRIFNNKNMCNIGEENHDIK